MGIKIEIEKFAASKNLTLREYQKTNFRNIERDYEAGKIDAGAVIAKVHYEFKKGGKVLSSSEESELKSKLK